MFGINVTYTMKPGKRETFLRQVAACGALQAVRREEGCLQYEYFNSVENQDRLLLVEKWTSRDAQQIHMTQPHMSQIIALKEACATDAVLETYEL